jgi:hypothetical protein
MPRKANVYSILVASPSDVKEERAVVAKIIDEWNYAHSATRGVVLEAVRWETHSYPELGDRAQSIINSQIVDRCDVLVGIFGIQLGTDTGVAPSGTAEEIGRFLTSQKPTSVYFSNRPVPPRSIDIEGYQRLKDFQQEMYKLGLVGSFSDLADLEQKLRGDLSRVMNKLAPAGKTVSENRRIKDYNRKSAFQSALRAAKQKPLIRGDRYTRNDIITNDGDVRILESWEGVVSIDGQPLREIPNLFLSRAGHQATWKCVSFLPNQSVDLLWERGPTGDFIGRFVFNPALSSVPISFSTERFIRNGVSFTQAERMQATNGKEIEEEFWTEYRNIWRVCIFSIKFPEHRFPRVFEASAYSLEGQKLEQESSLIGAGFKPWPEIQTLTFSIIEPLPGVKYSVRWQLAEDSSSQLSANETGLVDETTRRLLGLRNGCAPPQALTEWLGEISRVFTALVSPASEAFFAVILYVYDRQKSGLCCVATLNADEIERNWEGFFFKPGRGVVGKAFRRRSVEIFLAMKVQDDLNAFEEVEGQESKPSLVVCVPLFLADRIDRVMAIASLETSAPSTETLQFINQTSATQEIAAALRGRFELLADAITVSKAQAFWTNHIDPS